MPRRITPGDHARQFVTRTIAGRQLALERAAGAPVVLLFLGAVERPEAATAARAVAAAAARWTALGASVIGIADDAAAAVAAFARAHEIDFDLVAGGAAIGNAYGLAEGAADVHAVVLSANLRAIGVLDLAGAGGAGTLVERCCALIAALPGEEARDIAMQAPVLLIPEVLDRALCRRLIATYEASGGEDSGFMKQRPDGTVAHVLDYANKARRDHLLTRNDPVYGTVLELVGLRVRPEVRKTFHFDCTRIERFVVACYDSAVHGFFGAHRDNTTTATAHRIFAMTLNLNTEEYEGGHLRFPEYAPHRYRPPTGGAIVFSGSMLHEALPVTRGCRYALLSFFYGEAQEKTRRAYVERHGQGFETVDRNVAAALPGADTSGEAVR